MQSGIKTQLVSLARSSFPLSPSQEENARESSKKDTSVLTNDCRQTMGIVSLSIIATCVTLLVVNKMSETMDDSS